MYCSNRPSQIPRLDGWMKTLFEDGRHIWEVSPCSCGGCDSDLLSARRGPKHGREFTRLQRYWDRRFEYWPNFDQGIVTDGVGLFSVTPWDSAVQIAMMLDDYYPNDSPLIIDACCGVGGNTTAFAKVIDQSRVVGVDNSTTRILCAKNNAKVCGTDANTSFIKSDAVRFVEALRASARFVFVSPPWGGPGYNISAVEDIPFDIVELIIASEKGCVGNKPRVAVLLPRNFPKKEAKRLVVSGTKLSMFYVTSGPNNRVIATCYMYGKIK